MATNPVNPPTNVGDYQSVTGAIVNNLRTAPRAGTWVTPVLGNREVWNTEDRGRVGVRSGEILVPENGCPIFFADRAGEA